MSKNRNGRNMKEFLKYTLLWVSQNLSIPFWTIGHIHLMTSIYEDLHEIIASIGMNIIVALGFIVGYLEEREKEK